MGNKKRHSESTTENDQQPKKKQVLTSSVKRYQLNIEHKNIKKETEIDQPIPDLIPIKKEEEIEEPLCPDVPKETFCAATFTSGTSL